MDELTVLSSVHFSVRDTRLPEPSPTLHSVVGKEHGKVMKDHLGNGHLDRGILRN
jgi:hypothetical protein